MMTRLREFTYEHPHYKTFSLEKILSPKIQKRVLYPKTPFPWGTGPI